jgi:hypothetical protein
VLPGLKERRLNGRHKISAEFSYAYVDAIGGTGWGLGRIVNISAYGLLFDTDRMFKPDTRLELSLPWPGSSLQSGSLTAIITGRVVRSNRNSTAITIERYEFKALARFAET